ncbi:MAG: penicillin-binding protein 2 [Bacteroidales bacterium]|nr:penicillin-binding protein 2 [Bacteroidales bacterium]
MKDSFNNRRYVIIAAIVFVALSFLVKLFHIQVIDDKYRLSAENNVLRYVVQYPARGLIYDRNGELMVYNQAAYDLMVIPAQTTEIDTMAFCEDLGITKEYFIDGMKSARNYSSRAASVFLKQMSAETYALFQEKMFQYPGFYVQPRTLRKYSRPVGAHLLGYVSEVDEAQIKKDPYYKLGDYIGTQGIESTYESVLRGKKGVKIYMVDVYNRIQGSYADGELDTLAVQGTDIISSIDLDLQEYGEMLMRNKTGSIVAIEPSTGEILTLISSPNYDPNLLVGRVRSENYSTLLADTILKPLFNRATMASYPPGSTFKPVVGLVGLQEQVIQTDTKFACNRGYLFVGCHSHASPLDLSSALATSCNAYFCQVFRRSLENAGFSRTDEAYEKWREYVTSFGFGQKLGTDLANELSGNIPTTSYYDRYYGENRWRALTVISLSIGQGEIGVTPIQMVNMTAAIANRGYYYTPHIVKGIKGGRIDTAFTTKHVIPIDKEYFEDVIDGMEKAVNGGGTAGATATSVYMKDITICGKTGTAQNPHGEDHAVFIAFAPKDDPKIAIAVYVENAGYGATYSAPIARLMIEKYLKGTISNPALENRVLEMNITDRLIKEALEKQAQKSETNN